ncbi:hypothetical protein JCM11491_005510 [Sporobolomyces phaffii]
MQPLRHRDTPSRPRQSDPRTQQAKGLGLELKNLLKASDPWDRQVEFQRDATRKAYLKVVFSTPSLTSSSLALLSSNRSSSNLVSNSTALEALNLLWLETTHVLITLYRSKLAKMDKQIAENPKPPSRRATAASSDKRGGNDGNVQYARPPVSAGSTPANPSAVGPVARRKLLQQFQKFLAGEQDFWKIIVNRLSSRLLPAEQLELRPLGIIATQYDDTNTSSQPLPDEEQVSDDEKKRRRLEVLPLVHKTLICYGDLERYIEYNSDSPTPTPAPRTGGGRRGGKKNESGRGAATIVKTYTKAAECYRQANLLLPDDGNSHNQLAVLAQYASDPLASAYHYYRALTSRIPFSTAIKNLNIAYSKTLQRYDFEAQRRRDDRSTDEFDGADEVKRFREAFLALHGVFFTKTKLTEISSLMSRVDETFATCTRERLIVSDGVLKIVVTALAALWHARLTRSKSLNDNSTVYGSRTKPKSLAAQTASDNGTAASHPKKANATTGEAAALGGEGPKLEAHILVHVLQLYTTLLSASSAETNELFTSSASSALDSALEGGATPLAGDDEGRRGPESNISAVLRRSVPALRILGRWLSGQLDYIERVEKRVADKEKKRLRAKTRTSGGTSSLEEAQRSLDSSGAAAGGGGGGGASGVFVTSGQLGSSLDNFWTAFADFANSIKLAFPSGTGGQKALPVLEDGVWLEEDVECLGFSPLRKRNGAAGDAASSREGARRVGRDVHPNQEVLMRIEEAHRLAEEMVDSPLSRIALIDGAYVFMPSEDVYLAEGHEEEVEVVGRDVDMVDREGHVDEEDTEMRDHSTEDDPIDRAMRTAANQLDLDGVEEDDVSEDDDAEEEEQIVFSGSRNSSQVQAPPSSAKQSPAPPDLLPSRQDSFSSRSPNRSSIVTAADLRQQLFAPGPPVQPVPATATPTRSASQPPSSAQTHSPSLPVPSSGPSSPNALSSIWGAPPAPAPYHTSTSNLSGPSLLPPNQNSRMTAHSFEAIPNLTHNAFTAHKQQYAAAASQPQVPAPLASPQLFGGHPAFAAPPAPLHQHPQSQPPSFSRVDSDYPRSYPRAPTTTASLPATPHSPLGPVPHYHPPGLSTAHVGLNPLPTQFAASMRTASTGGFGYGVPPTTRESVGEGGWPHHLGRGPGS